MGWGSWQTTLLDFYNRWNGTSYELILRDTFIRSFRTVFGHLYNTTWYQQDRTSPHYAIQVRTLLDRDFQNCWIGGRGAIEWPPRSPNLNPLDYFFRG